MSLTVDVAEQAGILAAGIKSRQDKIAQIQQAIDGGWLVSRFAAMGPGENEVSLILDRLDPTTSLNALNFALAVYQAQLADLNAQLAALTV